MALSNLYDSQDPYIHSRIDNFARGIWSVSLQNKQGSGNKIRIKSLIARLTTIRTSLYDRTKKFLEGFPTLEALLNNGNTNNFYNIAMQVLSSPRIYNAIKNSFDFDAFYQDPQVQNKFSQEFQKIIENSNAYTEIKTQLFNEISGLSGKEQKEKLLIFFPNNKNIENIINNAFTHKFKSETGKFKNLMKQVTLESANVFNKNVDLKAIFLSTFKSMFRQLASTENPSSDPKEVENYLNNFEKLVNDTNFWNLEVKNILGRIGEDINVAANTAAAGTQILFRIGNISEKGIQDMIGSDLFQKLSVAKSINTEGTQSESDLLIRNPITGEIARVQSKNYSAIMEGVLAGKNIQPLLQIHQGYQETVLDLFQKIQDFGASNSLNKDEQNILCYLIGNSLWFNKIPSARNLTEDRSALGHAMRNINEYLTMALQELLGFYVEGMDTDSIASVGNLFYLINNSIYIPTYYIIDQIIIGLKDFDQNIFSLYATLDWDSVSIDEDPDTFQRRKRDSWTTPYDPNNLYEDSGLLSVGKAMGASIIKQAKINRINLRVDLPTLLKSSFKFDEATMAYIVRYQTHNHE